LQGFDEQVEIKEPALKTRSAVCASLVAVRLRHFTQLRPHQWPFLET
jgi:hypothetical protein